ERDRDLLVLEEEVLRVADGRCTNSDLVIIGGVHEDETIAVCVQVREVATIDILDVDLRAGVVCAVYRLAGDDVLQLGAHECAALTGLDMLKLDDVPELSVDGENDAVLDVCCGCHA